MVRVSVSESLTQHTSKIAQVDRVRYRLVLMPEAVHVRAEILERMLQEARREPGQECCGLLGGTGGVITTIFPARNALASGAGAISRTFPAGKALAGARAYEIAAGELFRIFREMRDAGLQHLGIYHSHPEGDNQPSPSDIERAYYPEAAYFILSPQPDAPRPARAFTIRDGKVTELRIEMVVS